MNDELIILLFRYLSSRRNSHWLQGCSHTHTDQIIQRILANEIFPTSLNIFVEVSCLLKKKLIKLMSEDVVEFLCDVRGVNCSYAFSPCIFSIQNGFMLKRSTETNLIYLLNFCHTNIYKGLQVDVSYTDFCAAFDKVSHFLLLSKWLNYGVHANFIEWLRMYLTDRYININIGTSVSSSWNNVTDVLVFVLFSSSSLVKNVHVLLILLGVYYLA